MVDCGNLRCFQERRLFKKDLQSWSKKIPIVVALEAIAENVGSKRKVRKLFEPFNCLEPDEPQDWEPQENCFYCKDRIQLLFDAIEKTDSKDGGKILRDHPSLRHLGDVLPFLPQFYTSDFGRDILSDIKTAFNEQEILPPVSEPTSAPNIQLKVPSMVLSKTRKEAPVSNSKGYSTEDLLTAVQEVRNGKLGTQRAASLYGIPRSTLRNKMFKMDADESLMTDDDCSSNEAQTSHKPQPISTQENPLLLTDLLQLSSMQYLAPVTLPYFLHPDMFLISAFQELEWEKKLQAIRHKHNLGKKSMNHYKVKALSSHKLKPFQFDLIQKLTKERLELERRMQAKNSEPAYLGSHSGQLQSLENCSTVKKLKQEPVEPTMNSGALMQSAIYKSLHRNQLFSVLNTGDLCQIGPKDLADHCDSSPISSKKSSVQDAKSSLGLNESKMKIHDSLYKYENTRIGETLKDIIVKTISEKVKCKLEAADFSGLVANSYNENLNAQETMSAFCVPESLSPPKKIKRQHEQDQEQDIPQSADTKLSSHLSKNGSGSPTKKTRPKRGQYRKYNSQLLTEAVKAVQRGEMSVHRAGSYYGVPHSTLEYKVKERHLLRQKKIKEQQELKMKNELEAAKTKQTEQKSAALAKDKKESAPDLIEKPRLDPSWLTPYSGPGQFDNTGSLSIFGSGFSLSTPASELLRKLQHQVQSKSESSDESLPGSSDFAPALEGYIYLN